MMRPLFIVIPVDLDIGLAGGGSDINEHTNLAWVPSPPGVGCRDGDRGACSSDNLPLLKTAILTSA